MVTGSYNAVWIYSHSGLTTMRWQELRATVAEMPELAAAVSLPNGDVLSLGLLCHTLPGEGTWATGGWNVEHDVCSGSREADQCSWQNLCQRL